MAKLKGPMNLCMTSSQIIIFGFLAVILTGTFLLMLPIASRAGNATPFLEAFFTATSATCVTGLVVQDTGTYWSLFGQAIILLLIQIGGMGVVTIAITIAKLSGRKIGLAQRSTLQEAIAAPNVGGIIRLIGFIVTTVITLELIGAAIMFSVFYKEYGVIKGIWYAVFHSISAFCNAGFDLNGVKAEYSSLTGYVGNPVINITIMSLIIIGGLGFTTWEEIKTKRGNFQKYKLQTKIILATTAIIIILPAIFFFFHEFSQGQWDFLSTGEKILASFFQAVTPRTAGFNTVEYGKFSESGQFITVILMLIGGGPGSTAGGMKVTTLAILLITARSVFKMEHEPHCMGREIEHEIVKQTITIMLMYLALCICGGLTICCIEKIPILICLFESASAIGTVGLTLGVTPKLSECSLVILIVLMFIGRVGGLTLIFATKLKRKSHITRLPKEKVMVG